MLPRAWEGWHQSREWDRASLVQHFQWHHLLVAPGQHLARRHWCSQGSLHFRSWLGFVVVCLGGQILPHAAALFYGSYCLSRSSSSPSFLPHPMFLSTKQPVCLRTVFFFSYPQWKSFEFHLPGPVVCAMLKAEGV